MVEESLVERRKVMDGRKMKVTIGFCFVYFALKKLELHFFLLYFLNIWNLFFF